MRGKMADDRTLFVFSDLHTYGTVISGGIILLLATKLPFGIPGVTE